MGELRRRETDRARACLGATGFLAYIFAFDHLFVRGALLVKLESCE
jgi:hypothetical protein